MAKNFKVEIDWKLLERIAEFYEFPVVVFLGNKKMFKSKTRENYFRKKLEKIKKIIDD